MKCKRTAYDHKTGGFISQFYYRKFSDCPFLNTGNYNSRKGSINRRSSRISGDYLIYVEEDAIIGLFE